MPSFRVIFSTIPVDEISQPLLPLSLTLYASERKALDPTAFKSFVRVLLLGFFILIV